MTWFSASRRFSGVASRNLQDDRSACTALVRSAAMIAGNVEFICCSMRRRITSSISGKLKLRLSFFSVIIDCMGLDFSDWINSPVAVPDLPRHFGNALCGNPADRTK